MIGFQRVEVKRCGQERSEIRSNQAARLVRIAERRRRTPLPPRITSAYAGTAYSVQSRTSAAAVLYVAKPTDARVLYVGLTRHKFDARVGAERDRLEAAVRQRQSDRRAAPSETSIRERLFTEARSYAEKANAVDYVDDRIAFMRTGQIAIQRDAPSFNLGLVARSAQRLFEATWQESGDQSLTVPAWRLVDGMRHMQQQASERVAEVVRAVRARIELRIKERVVDREWHLEGKAAIEVKELRREAQDSSAVVAEQGRQETLERISTPPRGGAAVFQNSIACFSRLLPQAEVLDSGRQGFGLVRPAECRDFRRILLKGLVIQDVTICGCIVITAHPKADKIPNVRTVSEPVSASDVIHINADLGHAWLTSGRQQSCGYEKNLPSHGVSPKFENVNAHQLRFAKHSSRSLADGIGTKTLRL